MQLIKRFEFPDWIPADRFIRLLPKFFSCLIIGPNGWLWAASITSRSNLDHHWFPLTWIWLFTFWVSHALNTLPHRHIEKHVVATNQTMSTRSWVGDKISCYSSVKRCHLCDILSTTSREEGKTSCSDISHGESIVAWYGDRWSNSRNGEKKPSGQDGNSRELSGANKTKVWQKKSNLGTHQKGNNPISFVHCPLLSFKRVYENNWRFNCWCVESGYLAQQEGSWIWW